MSAAADSGSKPTIVLQTEGVRIPAGFTELDGFRQWARSDEFPERGRIDWIGGEVKVDMSPEEINTHGTLKSAIAGALRGIVEEPSLGVVLIDRTRISSPTADLSVEPDVVVIFFESLRTGKAKLVPTARKRAGRYIEIEGAADIVVEVVSESDPVKDWEDLRARYWTAGVEEYWVADARRDPLRFVIFRRDAGGYAETPPGPDGWIRSARLDAAVRLVALPAVEGVIRYRLENRPAT